jgi:hypothetical protein
MQSVIASGRYGQALRWRGRRQATALQMNGGLNAVAPWFWGCLALNLACYAYFCFDGSFSHLSGASIRPWDLTGERLFVSALPFFPWRQYSTWLLSRCQDVWPKMRDEG